MQFIDQQFVTTALELPGHRIVRNFGFLLTEPPPRLPEEDLVLPGARIKE